MDLLASLNVDDLPEQQTRTLHLVDANPDFQLNLGFDACCSCGTSLLASECTSICCRACQRVSYCSDACRLKDADILRLNETATEEQHEIDDPPETAFGHTAVVCALLNLCNDDEAIDNGESDSLDRAPKEAATNRVRSEYESYPATIANVILEGPCYQAALRNAHHQKLTIHVVGASEDAELSQGPTHIHDNRTASRTAVCQDYADALAELADRWKLPSIELLFVGPDCPEIPWNESVSLYHLDKCIGTLNVRSLRYLYHGESLRQEPKADLVVWFNPGFSCPDYTHWVETLQYIPNGTPFLLTTNTEMEGIADCQYLLDQDKIQSLPPGLAEIFGVYCTSDDDDGGIDNTSFFALNPFAGSRVRQNGTMANDLFVKNRWMLGGILNSFLPTTTANDNDTFLPKMKRTKTDANETNSKASNPALI
jgi:hypothetical protein